MADTLKALQETAEVVTAQNGETVVVADAEALADHVSTFDVPTVEIADDDPILADLFGENEEDDGSDLFAE